MSPEPRHSIVDTASPGRSNLIPSPANAGQPIVSLHCYKATCQHVDHQHLRYFSAVTSGGNRQPQLWHVISPSQLLYFRLAFAGFCEVPNGQSLQSVKTPPRSSLILSHLRSPSCLSLATGIWWGLP